MKTKNLILKIMIILLLAFSLIAIIGSVAATTKTPQDVSELIIEIVETTATTEASAPTIVTEPSIEQVATEPFIPESMIEETIYEPVVFDSSIIFTSEYVVDDEHIPYMLFTPSTANDGGDIPLIIWLHGSGERNVNPDTFSRSGLLNVMNKWHMEGFNAYVICPQLVGKWNHGVWSCDQSVNNVQSLIDYFVEAYNVDTDKIIIAGHSLGAQGALYMAFKMPDRFCKLAVLSGYDIDGDLNTIRIPTIGYVEHNTDSTTFMKNKFIPVFGEDVTTVYTAEHGAIPSLAFNEDLDENGRSDLIEWMLEN